jgi:hypothetical protein
MEKLQIDLTDLNTAYGAVALYLEDADSVEYVRSDVACVYRRIDGFLTLAFDLETRQLQGFRLKGFKNFFLKYLKPRYELLDADFIPLISVIEEAVQVIGDKAVRNDATRDAYKQARWMALQDKVAMEPLPLAA